MCGIVGWIDLEGAPVERGILERMGDAIRHRGPDDAGYLIAGNVGLGHRRLSIVDLSGGRQPLGNEDGSVWVVFNGEIYNFHELRADLLRRGHRLATHSDTEVIVHLYEELGAECVRPLRGMFAFAVWDSRRRQLLLARDRVGKKPLFYAASPRHFLFASELQALLRHPHADRTVDPTAIDDYLTYGYVPAPRSAYCGIRKLEPAHVLTLQLAPDVPDGARLGTERYWRLNYQPKARLDDRQAAEGLREVLTGAVRLRMIADVPVGALLSGGLDSSLVVALMSRVSSRPVRTFSIGFPPRGFDERPYARLVAQRYGTEHSELIVRPEAVDVLPILVRHYGEPYADSSAIPSYYVAQLTRQHVTVALNGDGGDEALAGYERYLGHLLAAHYQRIPRAARRWLVEPLLRCVPGSLPRVSRLLQARRFSEAAGLPPGERYLHWMSYCSPAWKARLYTPAFRECLAGRDAGAWLRDKLAASGGDALDQVLAADVESYLPDDLLVKMDIASMAHGLEARSPFLDHHVLEYCAQLPTRQKIRGAQRKWLGMQLARELLPPQNVRRRKMGFGVPLADWMRGPLRPLVEDTLLAPAARSTQYLAADAVAELYREHCSGRRDRSATLWALLFLELWLRQDAAA